MAGPAAAAYAATSALARAGERQDADVQEGRGGHGRLTQPPADPGPEGRAVHDQQNPVQPHDAAAAHGGSWCRPDWIGDGPDVRAWTGNPPCGTRRGLAGAVASLTQRAAVRSFSLFGSDVTVLDLGTTVPPWITSWLTGSGRVFRGMWLLLLWDHACAMRRHTRLACARVSCGRRERARTGYGGAPVTPNCRGAGALSRGPGGRGHRGRGHGGGRVQFCLRDQEPALLAHAGRGPVKQRARQTERATAQNTPRHKKEDSRAMRRNTYPGLAVMRLVRATACRALSRPSVRAGLKRMPPVALALLPKRRP